MSEIPNALSKWQVLYQNYEQSVWQSDKVTLMTSKIIGTKEEHPDQEILKALAKEISFWRNKEFRHYVKKHERRASKDSTNAETINFDKVENEIDKQLEVFSGEPVQTIVQTEEPEQGGTRVDPSQIELYEINENTRIYASIYPTSFKCQNIRCGHYEILDPRGKINLVCPCCKEAWCSNCGKSMQFKNDKCLVCNNPIRRNELIQYSYVFACPRCANMEELTPAIVKLRDVMGKLIPCKNPKIKCGGHMHLFKYRSFTDAAWKCETCNHEERVNKFCKCHIAKDEDRGLKAISSAMKPISTGVPSLTSPLIKSYLYMGTSFVTLSSLENEYNKSKSIHTDAWSLRDEVIGADLEMLKEQYGIINAFTVPEITLHTIVFGFKSGIQSFPTRITDDERLACLFNHGQKYYCYTVKSTGKGLVIVLDKEKIMSIIKNSGHAEFDTYKKLSDYTKSYMEIEKFQPILENPERSPLIALLHTIEHVLLQSLIDQTGLEDFGSKILLDDCCIVLFEKGELYSGGLVQITEGKQGTEFKKLLINARKHLKNCPQLCKEGCIACVFINDFYCQPYLPNEISRWFPANSLLNRSIAEKFFSTNS